MRMTVLSVVIGLGVLGVTPAGAQQVDIAIPAPESKAEPLVIVPGDHGQATRPSDADYYPHPSLVRHVPAFVGPMSSPTEPTTSTARAGIGGWTAPNTPVGSSQTAWREVTGYFAFGFAFQWEGPPAATRTSR